jgi:benzoylformate decarboxylase
VGRGHRLVAEGSARPAPEPMARARLLPQVSNRPLTPPEVYAVLSRVRPPDAVIVNESTSTMAQQIEWLPTVRTGSFQYPVQALWTAAQHQLPIVYVVMRNNEYSILKSFAVLEDTPGVPGLDLPGLGIASVARGFGCRAADVATAEELEQEFKTALTADTTTVIVVSTQPQKAML